MTPSFVLVATLLVGCGGGSSTLTSPPGPAAGPGSMDRGGGYDVVLEGGRIVDGTGNAWFPGDVGIRGDRIAAITPPGMLADASARSRLDVTGMVVAPGFIDIQSHSRSAFLGDGDGRVVSKTTMGVTTEILGESTSNGPASSAMLAASGGAAGRTVFGTFGERMDAMEAHLASVNYGSFVGASTVRVLGKGQPMGGSSAAELQSMQDAVRQSLQEGAFGVGSALIYPPGNFASTDELIAINQGKDWVDTAFDLVLAERGRIGTIFSMMREENVALQIAQPWIEFGTGAAGADPVGARGLTQPRAYGTFTRVLGRYVREQGATTLEEVLRKMSSAVATRLHIKNRGSLKEGFFADVVVFDPETVGDNATYEAPHQVSTGMHEVFVNGVAVIASGQHTGALPGRPVRGPGWTGWRR